MREMSDADSGPSRFRTTAWSVVAAAQNHDSETYQRSLQYLCKTYWKPIYNYTRRRGFDHDTARDLTQDFFAMFLEKGFVDSADRERGKFRTFLLTALTRFLSKQYRKQKKHRNTVPLEVAQFENGETMMHDELYEEATPEDAFNRSWAHSLIAQTLQRMREECTEGRQGLYARVFAAYIESATDTRPKSYREIGEVFDLSETDVTNYLHRGRNIFQKMLREEVRQSVTTDAEVEEEIRDLQRYFA